MTDRYGAENHLLRRWTMNEAGVIGCFHDAIDVRLHSAEIVAAVEAHNELLLAAKVEREAYQAALRVSYPHGEPETIPAPTEEDPDATAPNPLHVAWTEAQAVISGVSAAVLAWMAADGPEPEEEDEDEHDGWLASISLRDMTYRDTAPDFEVVTDSPLLRPLKAWAFWAVVDMTEGLRDAVYTAIDAIPDAAQKAATKARFERTEEYRGFDPLFAQLRPAVGMTDAQFLTLWTAGLALQDAA